MIIDLAGYTGEDVRCDLCIIGAGAAGITIAREFQNGKHKRPQTQKGWQYLEVLWFQL